MDNSSQPTEPSGAAPFGAPLDLTPFKGNALLAALSSQSLQHFAPHLRPMLFHAGTALFEVECECEAVYFPKSGIISLVLSSTSGVNVEVGLVGPEGVAGLLDAVTGSRNSSRAQVQVAGSGWRLPASILRDEFQQNAEVCAAFLHHQRALSKIASQNVLCNRLHSADQRLAKWLLMAHDRMQRDELELTHEFLATMLGSRRVAVTLAAASLREAGLIDYRRGFITILDRDGLENLACECYAVIKSQYDFQERQG